METGAALDGMNARRGKAEPQRRRFNDLLRSDVLRMNELQVWFMAEYLVNVPVVRI